MNPTPRLTLAAACFAALPSAAMAQAFDLTVFHNNDGESELLPTQINGVEVGGAARFQSVINRQRALVGNSLLVSSGDNLLAGPVIDLAMDSGTFYDARFINGLGYDALAIGNHEFDFGPQFLADFIGQTSASIPFLSANLDFSGEASLQALVDSGRIRPRTVVTVGGEEVGLIGLTTPDLATISNPGNVTIRSDLANVVQEQVTALQNEGVDKIVLLSHLQSINNELDLVGNIRGVDAIIAGGGDELLIDSNPVAPGDEGLPTLSYPQVRTDLDGTNVPVVTTTGQYRYLGQLELAFSGGNVTGFGGDAYRVVDQSLPDGVAPDANTFNTIEEPLRADLADLATVVGRTEVTLDGTRSLVRTQETNFGDLIVDAILDTAQESSVRLNADTPIIGFTNGGGIRNSVVIPSGDDITLLDVRRALPFGNNVVIIEDLSVSQLLAVLENAVSQVENVAGRFAQVAGFRFTFDPDAAAFDRIVDVTLDGGTVLVEDGQIAAGAENFLIDVATVDFLAGGGDGYPLADLTAIGTGVTYDEALLEFLGDELGGVVTSNLYPEAGLGRITAVPEPTLGLGLGLAGVGLLALRRRRGAA